MFWEGSRWLGHDVIDGNMCSNVGAIQGKMSNINYKCTSGWIKLVLCSTSFVVPHTQPLWTVEPEELGRWPWCCRVRRRVKTCNQTFLGVSQPSVCSFVSFFKNA